MSLADGAIVVLPAGGLGSRIGMPFSKELLPLPGGGAAIDHIIELTINSKVVDRIVVVIRKHKVDIVDHLAKYADQGMLAIVHQRSDVVDHCGAMMSAAHLFGEKNIMLLPDHILQFENGRSPVAELLDRLDRTSMAFLAADIEAVPWASKAGAVKVARKNGESVVIDYTEHPDRPREYDGVWTAVAFRREVVSQALSVMARAKAGLSIPHDELLACGIAGAGVVWVDGYLDIGEWPRFAKLWNGDCR
ncbi:MAG: NTP transferase domain-containing protein [Streptosporangiaceae bacterium]|nr:NTP transferase domain-containing protein [Streptosporangiaceae bacterium]